ncbi:MAG: STAS domain-containing protein [Proteobacteria bacterium]|nr:STAS domain-containing protein [Pseudomonadota bacterium]
MADKIPVMKVGPLLIVSIQTELIDTTINELQQAILAKISASNSEAVVIDISSQELVDSYVANVLVDTAKMVSLMGSKMVLVGMQAAVTLTLVEMGMTLPDIPTAIDLEEGLAKIGYHIARLTEDEADESDEADAETE